MKRSLAKTSVLIAILLFINPVTLMAEHDTLIIDARDSGDPRATAGNQWTLVTDNVMGGISQGTLVPDVIENRSCLRMRGDVSLENNGGFIQMALNLPEAIISHAADYTGIMLDVAGNDEEYNVHLRTRDIQHPWQSYRASFVATRQWQTVYLPFAGFKPHRIDTALAINRLQRIGLVAIGREFSADLCLGKIGFYK